MRTYFLIPFTLIVLSLAMIACGGASTPQVVQETVEVEKEVTTVVEQEVEKEVTTVVEQEVVVTATPSALGRDSRTLIIAVANDPATEFDPDFGGGSEAENEFGKNMNGQWFQYARVDTGEGYMVADSTEFTGDLIESWEIESDDRTIHLKLREGIKFRDSDKEVTTDDIEAWMDRSFRTHAAGEWILNTAQIFSMDQLEIDGPYEFTLTLENPTPLFFPLLRDQSSVAINSETVATAEEAGDEFAQEYFTENDAVPGEYKLASRTTGVETVLEWDETYWMEEPYFTQVIMRVIPSSSDRALLLRQGEVDIAKGLSSDELDSLRDVPGVNVWSVPSRNQIVFGLLNDHPPFDDPQVRQAMAHAVPYEDIIQGVYSGQAQLAAGGPVPVESAYQVGADWPYTYDLDQAQALLEEAGYGDGFSFEVGVNTSNPRQEAMAVLIQAELAKLGVTMDIVRDPDAVYGEKKFNDEYDAWLDEMNAFVDHPYYYLFIFYRSGIYCCNFMNYQNERVDEINDILASETDPERTMELWTEAVELMVEDVPSVFIGEANFQVAMRDNIAGLVVEPDSLLSYHELYREE